MRKQWITRIGVLTVAMMIACVVPWFVVSVSSGTSLSAKEFPLLEKWTTELRGGIEPMTIVDNRLMIVL